MLAKLAATRTFNFYLAFWTVLHLEALQPERNPNPNNNNNPKQSFLFLQSRWSKKLFIKKDKKNDLVLLFRF
jgi:hypothetical protein